MAEMLPAMMTMTMMKATMTIMTTVTMNLVSILSQADWQTEDNLGPATDLSGFE